jgi:hypothetical protein
MVEDDSISGQPHPPKGRGLVVLVLAFLGLTAGLCAVLALVVTAGQAWVEHAQAQWPEATARVQRCGVDIYTHNPDTYWIDCSISYVVRGEDIISHVHSKGTPAPQRLVWQYPDPAGQLGRLQEWVDEHPEGTPIVMHYDPANPKKAVLVITDMPLGGPQAEYSLKLLGFCVVSCVVLLTLARIARPRVTAANGPG